MKLLTADQMRHLDERTIQELGLPSAVLMENAGRTTYQILRREFPDLAGPVVVVAGRGNNGGDGLVVARYLANDGFPVLVLLLAETVNLHGDARINLEVAQKLGILIHEVTSTEALLDQEAALRGAALVVDAILGTGLNAEVRGLYRQAIELINDGPTPVLAVDIPSGLSADSGQILGSAVRADVTVTYGWPKRGQILPPGRELVGRLWRVDISIPPAFAADCPVELADAAVLRDLLPPRPRRSHKGTYGHLFILAGSPGKTGAAALAAQAALRTGAGLVTVGVPASLNPILEVKLTEAMTLPLPEVPGEAVLGAAALPVIGDFAAGKAALALGPGLGTHSETVRLVQDLVTQTTLPTVIDADGLNALAANPACLGQASAPLILTPHPGEMARLTGLSTGHIQAHRLEVAGQLAHDHGVIVVLKGNQTIIAAPDVRLTINSTGNPALATGGTGDVLTGMIVGFLAQGLAPYDAARVAVYLHGLAADLWVQTQGQAGLLAGELSDGLPALIAAFAAGELPPQEEEICCARVIL